MESVLVFSVTLWCDDNTTALERGGGLKELHARIMRSSSLSTSFPVSSPYAARIRRDDSEGDMADSSQPAIGLSSNPSVLEGDSTVLDVGHLGLRYTSRGCAIYLSFDA